MQAQGYRFKWKSTSTQAKAQMRCNFHYIEVGASDLATASYLLLLHSLVSPSRPTTTEGRERTTGYEVDLVRHKTDMCLCYFLFPCALFRRKHGCRNKEKEKRIALGLAFAFMLASARFHDMRCSTSTYAYARACAASKNKLVSLC